MPKKWNDTSWQTYANLCRNKVSVSNPSDFNEKKPFKHAVPAFEDTPKFRGCESQSGVIYFIREFISVKHNSNYNKKIPTKIGYCKFGAIHQRYEDISRHHYKQLYVAHAQKVNDVVNLEFIVHLRYKKDNINGEWFNLSEYQIKDAIRFIDVDTVRYNEWESMAAIGWIFEGPNCLVSRENMKYFWG